MNYKKEFLIGCILITDFLLLCISSIDLEFWNKFYWRVSDVTMTSETLFFLMYIGLDINKMTSVWKCVYATILSFTLVNFISAVNIVILKLYLWDYCYVYVEEKITSLHSNYINDYAKPLIIFAVALILIRCFRLDKKSE